MGRGLALAVLCIAVLAVLAFVFEASHPQNSIHRPRRSPVAAPDGGRRTFPLQRDSAGQNHAVRGALPATQTMLLLDKLKSIEASISFQMVRRP